MAGPLSMAQWDRLSESVTIAENALAELALTVEDLVGVPSSLQGETVTYARVTEFTQAVVKPPTLQKMKVAS